MSFSDVVITGIGVVSPIGIGREAFWQSLCQGRSGVQRMERFEGAALPTSVAAEVRGFDPKPYVPHRKLLKVMSRDAQLGVAAAGLACREAGIVRGTVAPERFGVVLGGDQICSPITESVAIYGPCMVGGRFDFSRWGTAGMAASYPLNFLSVLPNMTASHVSIIHDARGPNNTIHQAEVSGLLAVSEAASVILRGAADVMIAGGASSQMTPFDCVRRCAMGILTRRQDEPSLLMRPFDAGRDGQVWGEGAAVVILESRRHAEARGAKILARVLSWAACCEPHPRQTAVQGIGLRRAMSLALERAELDGRGIGHVNAHGLSMVENDRIEAQAICDVVPQTPVTALKSYFGNLGAAGAVVELAASVLSFDAGLVPPTLNYERPDPGCSLRVIHGEPLASDRASTLAITWTPGGQAVGMVLAGEK